MHDCRTAAFEKCELLTGMLSQQRGTHKGRAPGSMALGASIRMVAYVISAYGTARHAGQFGLIAVVIVAVVVVRQRRASRVEGNAKLVEVRRDARYDSVLNADHHWCGNKPRLPLVKFCDCYVRRLPGRRPAGRYLE